jgi:hypothetical protein
MMLATMLGGDGACWQACGAGLANRYPQQPW